MMVDVTDFSRVNQRAPMIDGVGMQYGRFPANSQGQYIALRIVDTRHHPVDTIHSCISNARLFRLPWTFGSLHLETEEPFMKCSNSKQPRSVGVGCPTR